MALMQLYQDSIPDYTGNCTIVDLGFQIVPQLNDKWSAAADIWVFSMIGVFLFILIPFVLETPQLALRRWLYLLGVLYIMRGLVLIDTRYPRLPFKIDKYEPSNPIVGALAILVGAKTTGRDILFSGHTVNFFLIGSFTSRYTRYSILSYFIWAASLLGCLALLATREHYLADIVVAAIITKLAFWVYHFFFDSLYKRFWSPGIVLEGLETRHVTLPAVLEDSRGQMVTIDEHVPTSLVHYGFKKNGGLTRVLMTDPAVIGRERSFYRALKWLDSE
jgi:hypothetical protein